MHNLLNSNFAGEARHNNPSHCLTFYNYTPDFNDTHYASGDARFFTNMEGFFNNNNTFF